MRKHLLFLLLVAVVLVSGCVSYGGSQPQPNASQPPSSNAVTIQNFAFSPQSLTVKVGTTVKWTNLDTAPHTVTSDSGAFDSGQFSKGGSFSFTFGQPGTFDYHCSVHPYMKGTIVVEQQTV